MTKQTSSANRQAEEARLQTEQMRITRETELYTAYLRSLHRLPRALRMWLVYLRTWHKFVVTATPDTDTEKGHLEENKREARQIQKEAADDAHRELSECNAYADLLAVLDPELVGVHQRMRTTFHRIEQGTRNWLRDPECIPDHKGIDSLVEEFAASAAPLRTHVQRALGPPLWDGLPADPVSDS